jgi:hypothetical protein
MAEEITNEELARMIAHGFQGVDKQLANIKGDIESIDDQMDHLDARMGRMKADLHEVKGNIVYKYEFEDLAARVKYLESKLGIESGK